MDWSIPPKRQRGFTLAELMVSLTVMALLSVGLGSVLMVASRALPDADRPGVGLYQGWQAANQLAEELNEARFVTEHTASAIAFTVADRDGDGSPEHIRYAWSGTPGEPLTRSLNRATAVTVLADVNQCAFQYDVRTAVETYPGPPVEGPEILVSAYTQAKSLKDFRVKDSDWIGQYLAPDPNVFPAATLHWRVTRVRFEAKEEGSTDEPTYVQLRPADGSNKPTAVVLEQQTLDEALLSGSYEWQTSTFATDHALAVTDPLCLVLQGTGSGSAKIRFEDNKDLGATGRLKTTDGGGSWEYKTDKALRYEIYGRATVPGPDQTATRRYLTGVRLTVQTRGVEEPRIDTAVVLPNEPEVLSALWELDFDTYCPTLDLNGDGSVDWNNLDGISPASVANGVWTVDATLESSPPCDFNDLTTVTARARTSSTGVGASLRMNVDWSGGLYAPLRARLERLADGTQSLSVFQLASNLPAVTLLTVTGLPDAFVDLRFVVDPALDTVSVTVNGVHQATCTYTRVSAADAHRVVKLKTEGATAQFDAVSVRVGGSL